MNMYPTGMSPYFSPFPFCSQKGFDLGPVRTGKTVPSERQQHQKNQVIDW